MSKAGGRVVVLGRHRSLLMRSFVLLLSGAGVITSSSDDWHDLVPHDDVAALLVCDESGAGQVPRVLTALRGQHRHVIVVALAGVDRPDIDVRMPPGASIDDLMTALRSAVPPTRSEAAHVGDDLGAGLTVRECQVAVLLSDALSSAEIARVLGITANTVRTHVQNIMGKLGVSSRLEIAAEVAARGGSDTRVREAVL